MYGNHMINDPGGIRQRKVEPTKERCYYCNGLHDEDDLKNIVVNYTGTFICRKCDDKYETCYYCGEKIIKVSDIRYRHNKPHHSDCI